MAHGEKGESVIRDPVHGDIRLTSEELRILDTRQMQRLRGVRQLGTAFLVFPGAQHTRFEHSLGTLEMLDRLVQAVNTNRARRPLELLGVAEDETRVLRATALVHDVTHIPFGHNIEDQTGLLARHDSEARYRRILSPETELGAVLEDMGIRREVLGTLVPVGSEDLPVVPPYWRELISDTICADILDYLKRDAYYTGLNLLYDERVLHYFMIDRATGHLFVDISKRGLVREDILSELVRVLEARYFFSERVYYHHAKIAAGAMISEAVRLCLESGSLAPESLYDQTDESLFALLAAHAPADSDRARFLEELLAGLRSRRLFKRACVFPRYANREVQGSLLERFFDPERRGERESLQEEVRAAVAETHGEAPRVVLYCPARLMQLKEAATHVRFPGEDRVKPLSDFTDRIPRLVDLEASYQDLWKLYALASTSDPVVLAAVAREVTARLPEAVDVYRRGE